MYILRFRARGSTLVHRMDAPAGRYIGRTYDPTLGPAGGWPPSAEPDEVRGDLIVLHHYKQIVREGHLWPADEATAQLCGVKFDPKFGGEFDPPAAVQKAVEKYSPTA